MRFSGRHLCTILLTMLSFPTLLPTLLCAQTATVQTTKIPRSSVSGRITIKDKGVGGVLVALRKSDMGMMPYESYPRAISAPDG